ncbi:hypothetical protein F5883DRAFT_582878 [Diaporthe sp. PMI_573]|nr:hypothetical protein F5883DRAFT_582878 [Diaporthaceae sp. PMI_573]
MDANNGLELGLDNPSPSYSSLRSSLVDSHSPHSFAQSSWAKDLTTQRPQEGGISSGNDVMIDHNIFLTTPLIPSCLHPGNSRDMASDSQCHSMPTTTSIILQHMTMSDPGHPLTIPAPFPLFSDCILNGDFTSFVTDERSILFRRTPSPAADVKAATTPSRMCSSDSSHNTPTRNSRIGVSQASPEADKALTTHETSGVSKVTRKTHTCKYQGCEKKSYARPEHLKRHHNEFHSDRPKRWRCTFCEIPKTFTRCDNFCDHLKRHIEKSDGRRTRHDPGAALLLGELKRNRSNLRMPSLPKDRS